MSTSFKVVIPARYASTRLPGKALADIAGKPMVQWVYEQAGKSLADEVVVATDDDRIMEAVTGFGGNACMTREDHISGTDRIHETASLMGWKKDTVIVNVQGDEPLIPVSLVNQVANNLIANPGFRMATLCEPIDSVDDFLNPNIVKAVFAKNGKALYFSRAPIAWAADGITNARVEGGRAYTAAGVENAWRHIGLYAYTRGFLDDFVGWQPAPLEVREKLEQLRPMWYGDDLHIEEAIDASPVGVDTPEDLELIRNIVNSRKEGKDE